MIQKLGNTIVVLQNFVLFMYLLEFSTFAEQQMPKFVFSDCQTFMYLLDFSISAEQQINYVSGLQLLMYLLDVSSFAEQTMTKHLFRLSVFI